MMLLKKRQMVSLSLIAMVVVAGYLQCNNKKNDNMAVSDNTGGQKVYVNVSTDTPKKEDFFAKTKLERDIARGQNKEILQEISLDKNATDEVKKSAYEQMLKLVSDKDKETKIETMIKEIGFNNVIAILGDDESLDIIVKSPKLTSNLATQIANIGKRYTNISMSNIHVKSKN